VTATGDFEPEKIAVDSPGEILGAEASAYEDGMECLRSAAEEQLRCLAGQIALALGKKAAGGDLNSAKFLLAVAKERTRKGPWLRRDGPSEAQRLAAEPRWVEPVTEPSAESEDDSADAEI
jgi:hypothetical protein